ncbi:hypothetical protein EBAPG3_010585 [Nitrosospira lacus]|uniref:Uncharacterized protein n=1 Tax=Nitrosospira lacus TaxID=1288494 RepID=A0A1W6SQX6_9PROT|nr:hypothetical protein [Nitrosospira lacus]ARO88189.1 hypothetical protein EBAPG3_010585 [Nitrosospira lacus]
MVEIDAKPKKSTLAEIIDQTAHAAVGIVLMYLFVLFPLLGIAVLVMIIALLRELPQHEWRGYGRLDMIFWGVGCLLFMTVYYTIGVPDLESIKALITAWQA